MQLTHSPSPPIYPYQTYRLFLLPRLTVPSLPYLYIPFSLRHRATPSSRSLFSLSFLCILALASNHHSPSPSPISTLSYSFLLFARSRPLSLSVPLSLPLFDSTGLSILSGATFNPLPYSPSPPPLHPFFFLSSPTDTSRVDLFDVIIPFTLGTYIPPTLTTLGLPPAGDDNNGNDLVLFHRIAIYIYIYIVVSVLLFFFLSFSLFFFFFEPFLDTSIFDVCMYSVPAWCRCDVVGKITFAPVSF